MAGDTFFPFLTSGSGGAPTEKYYEALQAAAVGRYFKKPPPTSTVFHHHSHLTNMANNGCMKTLMVNPKVELMGNHETPIIPAQQPTPAPPRSSSRALVMSPPVPALLKKIRMANGEQVEGPGDKFTEWGEINGYESSTAVTAADESTKIGKDLENLQIKEQRPAAATEQDKQDLLFRLSLLKQVSTK